MTRKKTTRSKNLKLISKMPPLHHTLPDETFDYEISEVLNWISERPAIVNYVFDHAKNGGLIIYNPSTGKWQGVDWEED